MSNENTTQIEEEQGSMSDASKIDSTVQQNDALQELPSTEIMAETVYEEMSDYDKAIETKVIPKICENPVYNKKTRLLMDAKGHRLYTWIVEDENGDRTINLHQKYQNGEFSAMLTIQQADVILASLEETLSEPKLCRDIERFYVKLGKHYMNRFRGAKEDIISVRGIVDMIATDLPNIPAYKDDLTDLERVIFYQRVVDIVKQLSSQICNDHESYYPIDDQDLKFIAQSIGLDRVKLLRKLKKLDLLYLTSSAIGYQNNVRVKLKGEESKPVRRYCIIRDEKLENQDRSLEVYDG